MGRRIAIVPIFNEGHFLPYLIDNCINVLGINHFVLNDGMFPHGPEHTFFTDNYLLNYTIEGRWSFDLELTMPLCNYLSSKYKIPIELNMMYYDSELTSKEAFYQAYTTNLPTLYRDDFLFPLEADLFFRDTDKDNIETALSALQEGQGFGIEVYRFFESPRILMMDFMPVRKLVVKCGDGNFYNRLVGNIFDGDRDFALKREYSFNGYHYEWIRPGKYFMARIGQLSRPAGFWERVLANRDYIISNHTIPPDSFCPMMEYTGTHATALHKHCKWEEYYG